MTPDINEIRDLIHNNELFYVAGHISPDGDAIGSAYGLGLALEKLGKNVKVLLEDYHSRYDIIPGEHLLYKGEEFLKEAVFICVDCASITRLTAAAQVAAENAETLVCVDHHFSNTCFANYNMVDVTASSTCELIYKLIDGFVELDRNIASALYSGMVTDTGGFRHATTGEETLRVASKLIAEGIPFTEIYTVLVHLRTYTEVKLLARVLSECRRSKDKSIIYACVTSDMLKNFEDAPDAIIQDLEGIVEYLMNTRSAKVSILIYERNNEDVKMSLRSRNVNVGAIAQKFGGGGHKLAAAATAKCTVFELRDQVLPLVEAALSQRFQECALSFGRVASIL